jgi:hypothetical protein
MFPLANPETRRRRKHMNGRLWPAALFIATTALVFDAAAQAPAPRGNTGGSPRDKTIEDKARSDEIERIRREAAKPGAKPDAPTFPIIKEDFERIQIVNGDVLQSRDVLRASVGPADYARVAEAASEIRKRAARLKSNLFPAEAEKGRDAEKPRAQKDPSDLKAMLAALDQAINDFVHNPIFTNLQVVDVQHSARARQDLDRVIKLSALLKKEADRMKKANGG